jgi:hypothetical protein
MQTAQKKAWGMGVCAIALSALTLAMPPQRAPATLPAMDDPVASIPSAHRISNWRPLDGRHVMVHVGAQDRYLLTLREACPGLNYAHNVGVTMSNNTIWAGFDAITTDSMRCPIKRIDRLVDAKSEGSAPGN